MNPKKIKIEMWSDFMCPLCYIGKTNLENALPEFQHEADIEMVYRPFQLFPDAPSNTGKNYYDYTSMTHGGLPVDYVREGNAKVIALAKTIGLNYNLDSLIPTNTLDALRIGLYAQEKGKAKEWTTRIYSAYLTEGLDIGDTQTLADLGSETGLDHDEILRILSGDQYKSQVRSERKYAEGLGIKGTPFFVMNNKHGVPGVRSKDDLLKLLNSIWMEENTMVISDETEGQSCSSEGSQCT